MIRGYFRGEITAINVVRHLYRCRAIVPQPRPSSHRRSRGFPFPVLCEESGECVFTCYKSDWICWKDSRRDMVQTGLIVFAAPYPTREIVVDKYPGPSSRGYLTLIRPVYSNHTSIIFMTIPRVPQNNPLVATEAITRKICGGRIQIPWISPPDYFTNSSIYLSIIRNNKVHIVNLITNPTINNSKQILSPCPPGPHPHTVPLRAPPTCSILPSRPRSYRDIMTAFGTRATLVIH